MSFVNSTSAVYIYINGEDLSDYLISGSLSDDSAYTNSIITTKGQIALGVDDYVLDFDRSKFPIGSKIQVWVKLDNGKIALHPKGTLYIINSTVSAEERTLNLDVGCSLAFISDKEENYQDAIDSLFANLIGGEAEDIFVIDQKDLSTLSALLEVTGDIIYQDAYGNIQKISAFGTDGLGSNIKPPKLTSFDKYTAISIESISETAIENNISKITVEASVDVPDTANAADAIQPLITSETKRTVETPRLGPAFWTVGSSAGGLFSTPQAAYETSGSIYITNEETEQLESETNPGCGTIKEPNEQPAGLSEWKLKCVGSAVNTSYPVPEKVTNGTYKTYNGPGNQVDYEHSWEECSASTWGSSAINNTLNDCSTIIGEWVSEANGLLSKANSHFQARDAEPMKKGAEMNPKYVYHNCNAQAFYKQAKKVADAADSLLSAASFIGSGANEIYGISSSTQTFNTFGAGGEIVKQVTKKYAPACTWDGQKAGSLSVNTQNYSFNLDATLPSSGPYDPESGPIGQFSSLRLESLSVKTYTYGSLVTIEEEVYTDYKNPKSSYSRKNYSSSSTRNATEPDRLSKENTINGKTFCTSSTQQKDLTVEIPIQNVDTGGIAIDWFGQGKAYEKTVSFPIQLVPLLPEQDPVTNTCGTLDPSEGLIRYEEILKNYGNILAKKIMGDNRGFRVTEKLRAEVFEYYPFYPINISVESLGEAYSSRAAASNWVFDSANAVCSFDCLLTGDIDSPSFIDPSNHIVFIRTEGTKILTREVLKLDSYVTSIKILSLPTTGTLRLNGVNVTLNQIINATSIDSNLFQFYIVGSATTDFSFTFQSFGASGFGIQSIEGIYPPLTTILITPETYGADGGEFTLNFTNDGLDCDAGNLDAGTTNGGLEIMNAGNFDTGASIVLPPPAIPGAPSGMGSVDPETEYGIYVVDPDEDPIEIITLPTIGGIVDPIYPTIIDVSIKLSIVIKLICEIIEVDGWNYGTFSVGLGTDIDFGTIPDPNAYNIDFGTFDAPLEPVIASSVV